MNNEVSEMDKSGGFEDFEGGSRETGQQSGNEYFAGDVENKISRLDVRGKVASDEQSRVSSTSAHFVQDSANITNPSEGGRSIEEVKFRLNVESDSSTEDSLDKDKTPEDVAIGYPNEEALHGEDSDSSDESNDSEVTSIISKKMPDLEHHEQSPNEQKSDSIIGYLSNGDSFGADLETSTLSPCFPLIRDTEKSQVKGKTDENEAEASSDSNESVIAEEENFDDDPEFNRQDFGSNDNDENIADDGSTTRQIDSDIELRVDKDVVDDDYRTSLTHVATVKDRTVCADGNSDEDDDDNDDNDQATASHDALATVLTVVGDDDDADHRTKDHITTAKEPSLDYDDITECKVKELTSDDDDDDHHHHHTARNHPAVAKDQKESDDHHDHMSTSPTTNFEKLISHDDDGHDHKTTIHAVKQLDYDHDDDNDGDGHLTSVRGLTSDDDDDDNDKHRTVTKTVKPWLDDDYNDDNDDDGHRTTIRELTSHGDNDDDGRLTTTPQTVKVPLLEYDDDDITKSHLLKSKEQVTDDGNDDHTTSSHISFAPGEAEGGDAYGHTVKSHITTDKDLKSDDDYDYASKSTITLIKDPAMDVDDYDHTTKSPVSTVKDSTLTDHEAVHEDVDDHSTTSPMTSVKELSADNHDDDHATSSHADDGVSMTKRPHDLPLNDGINIVSSSIDSKNIDEFKIPGMDKDLLKDSCETTSERLADFVSGENNADVSAITSGDVSGDTSGELSADVSCISSIDDEDEIEPAAYNITLENIYLINKKKSRMHKEVRRMKCDCSYEPDEPGFVGCGAGCMNRLLMIECGSKCSCGEFCTNKNFQKGCRYNLEVFRAGKKGWGLRTLEKIEEGAFIIEYCGEVVNYSEFMKRTETYDQERRKHYYFMTLKGNEIIDATRSGNISRFINHSCDPNCVTQKWTVNGFLRVGFFSLREIKSGEELSFDYQYQRYGEKAQKCLCGTAKCRGVIGELKQVPLKNTPTSCDSPKRKTKKKNISEYASESTFGEEIAEILGDNQKIVSANQALSLTRLMVTASALEDRRQFLRILREASEAKALKAFVKYNGLSLLWSWMVESPCGPSFKLEILNILKLLPVSNKNLLTESKLLPLVEKLSNCQDSQESTRSDEEGSSNSDNDNNEVVGDDAKDETASSSGKPKKDKVEKYKDSKDESPDVDRTDEDSDNPERNEEIISLAAELLDRWKLLKEVFKIPKKTPSTPDQPKQNIEFESLSLAADDNKRNGKRKFENDSPSSVFSPKRQFSPLISLNNNSPIKPLMESPTHSHLRESPSTSSPSSLSSKGTSESDPKQQNEGHNILLQRLMAVVKGDSGDPSRSRYSSDEAGDSRFPKGRGSFPRGGISSLSWRNNVQQFQDNMQVGRGARGGRGRARGRMRGTFNPSGFQQVDNNMQQPPGNPSSIQAQEFQQNQSREFRNRNFPVSGTNQLSDMNRLGSGSYNYQALGQDSYQSRPSEFQPPHNVHAERQQNIDSRLRNPGYDIQYGRQQQDWQTTTLAGQPPQGFNTARMPAMVNQQPPQGAPSQQFGGVPMMNQQAQNMPPPNFQHWNMNSSGPGLVAPNMRNQEMDAAQGVMNRPPNMPITNQPQHNPYGYQQPVMQNQPFEQQQQPNAYGQNTYGQQQQQQQQSASLSGPLNQGPATPSSIMKHLHEMVQHNKTSATSEQQQPQNVQQQQPHGGNTYANRTPETHDRSMNLGTPTKDHRGAGTESPSNAKPITSLPPNWKTATDPEGKVYYYHVVTRKTQWEMPKKEEESPARQANVSQKPAVASVPGPHTPPASPPHSPISPTRYNTRPPAISDPAVSTTRMSNLSVNSAELTPKQQRMRDHFKMKLSGVVVNCLNPYQKVDCKHARIAKVEDFKFLARKLTHGLMMKELARNRPDEELECNDSVKIKVKEYIRNYMKKYGEFYIRS